MKKYIPFLIVITLLATLAIRLKELPTVGIGICAFILVGIALLMDLYKLIGTIKNNQEKHNSVLFPMCFAQILEKAYKNEELKKHIDTLEKLLKEYFIDLNPIFKVLILVIAFLIYFL